MRAATLRSPAPAWLLAALVLLGAACSDESATARGEQALLDPAPAVEPAPAEPAPVIVETAPVVAFLGDSITAGLHLPADQAFPAVLQRRLAARGLPMKLVQAGVSGDTSAGGLRRLPWVLRSQPDVVVIELGGNDGLRGKPLVDISANLSAIVEGVIAAGARPVLVGMLIPHNYGQAYSSTFREIYHELADEYDVPLVPRFMERIGGRTEFNFPDLIHPNAAGHEILAEVLEPTLAEVLEALDG